MTTRYRVEYALKTHRRDQLIEWIKGLLAVPFVLHSQPTASYDGQGRQGDVLKRMAKTAHSRYAEIFRDVEELINDHSGYLPCQIDHSKQADTIQVAHQVREKKQETIGPSKLKHLVPSIGIFFTPLALEKAFEYQDERRRWVQFRYKSLVICCMSWTFRTFLGAQYYTSLSKRGMLTIKSSQDQLSPLRGPFLQRHPSHPEQRPDHERGSTRPPSIGHIRRRCHTL